MPKPLNKTFQKFEMADHFLPCLPNLEEQPFSLSDIEPNIELINHFPGLNPSHPDTSGLISSNKHNFFPGNLLENVPGFFLHDGNNVEPSVRDQVISKCNDSKENKRKSTDSSTPESSTANSFQESDNLSKRKSSTGRRKKVKGNGKEAKQPREVVHVRAKRGQATDSHSLAERIRREKINERFKCLQDIVPGCYKTMGMAVMLDETISYVQSLQNQVEFLSMKLNTASKFHGFNPDIDVVESMQEAKVFEKLKSQRAAATQFVYDLCPPVDLNSCYFFHMPHNP